MTRARTLAQVAGLAVIGLLASSAPMQAGAWTLDPASGQVIVSGLYAEAKEAFDEAGNAVAIPVFRKAEVHATGEYGLAEGITAIARSEVKSAAVGEKAPFDEARFGLSGLGMRARLWQHGATVVSVEASGRIALGAGEGAEKGDLDLRLLGGRSFELGPWSGFVDLQTAYRFRFGGGEDELRADATLGLRPMERVLLMAQSFNTIRVQETAAPAEDAYREHKLQMSLVYEVNDGLSVQIGGFGSVAGRHALRERGLLTALWFRF